MLPELQKYIETVDEIDANVAELRRKLNEIIDNHTDTLDESQYNEARTAWSEANRDRKSKKLSAANELGDVTEDALIKYIVHNYLSSFSDEVMLLLRVADGGFPAMEKLSEGEGWCSAWTEAVQSAHRDGVIVLTEVQIITSRLERSLQCEIGASSTARIMRTVEELVQAHVKADGRITDSLGE